MVAGIGPVQIAGNLDALRGATTVGKAGAAGDDLLGKIGTASDSRVAGAAGTGFGQAVGDALKKVGSQEVAVERAAEAAATGDLRSVTDYMIAATESQLTTQITVAVRDRAIAAFNDIMR
ncbi:MAG: flagellar hook-basal body complex protein FliE, partial [Acidimicrobiia bacterium]|nr:flagellar hook-basal body complex protein FliE [Acidimicrobiia bacterium]